MMKPYGIDPRLVIWIQKNTGHGLLSSGREAGKEQNRANFVPEILRNLNYDPLYFLKFDVDKFQDFL